MAEGRNGATSGVSLIFMTDMSRSVRRVIHWKGCRRWWTLSYSGDRWWLRYDAARVTRADDRRLIRF
jgi:hypothetical protein